MVDSPENINREAPRQEMGNREIDALNTMIRSGETAESINNALDKNFLENLKNSLHPDTAKQLRDAIKNITGYDQQNNLKQLYDYVVSICDTFDTTGKENDEHEDITDTLTMNDVLDQRNKDQYIYRINVVEYINAVAQDNSIPDNFLSAIKGILNGEKLSGSFLVKMAEFLGIDTKSDNRYGSRRIKNLGEKVFSMTDEKGLFAKLGKMYEHMDTNPNVVNFRNNPFEGRSLNDICNLLKINWNGDDINKTDPKITLFCRSLKLNSETFAQQFNSNNLDRKNRNNEALNNFSILSLLDQSKAITKTETEGTYKYGDVEFTQANFLTQLGITPDTIKTNLEGAGTVFAGSELENAISSKQNDRFNKIVENIHEASGNGHEVPENLPDKISTENIDKTRMRGKTHVKKEDVVTEINAAIESIKTIEDGNKKTEIINRITKVISALQDPGDQNPDGSQPKIKELQTTMKEESGQRIIIDGKFGPNTFGAMKNYINATTISVNPDESNDPESENNRERNGGNVNGESITEKNNNIENLPNKLNLSIYTEENFPYKDFGIPNGAKLYKSNDNGDEGIYYLYGNTVKGIHDLRKSKSYGKFRVSKEYKNDKWEFNYTLSDKEYIKQYLNNQFINELTSKGLNTNGKSIEYDKAKKGYYLKSFGKSFNIPANIQENHFFYNKNFNNGGGDIFCELRLMNLCNYLKGELYKDNRNGSFSFSTPGILKHDGKYIMKPTKFIRIYGNLSQNDGNRLTDFLNKNIEKDNNK